MNSDSLGGFQPSFRAHAALSHVIYRVVSFLNLFGGRFSVLILFGLSRRKSKPVETGWHILVILDHAINDVAIYRFAESRFKRLRSIRIG